MLKRLRKIISVLISILLVSLMVIPISAETNSNHNIEINNAKGVMRSLDSKIGIIESDKEFNYTLDKLNLALNGITMNIKTKIDDNEIEFNPKLHQSTLGYNAENTIFGIDSEISSGYQLTKFTIEKNASTFALMIPNKYMEGNTVVSLAIYNTSSNQNYYFQFIANEYNLINIKNDYTDNEKTNLVDYELANFAALPYKRVKQDIESLNIEIENSKTQKTTTSKILSDVSSSQKLNNSTEAEIIDQLLEQCKNGPIKMSSKALVPDIPDYLYQVQNEGWSENKSDYIDEGTNASRLTGYSIYHMPDSYSGNVLNYVMRYESILNFNWSSQQFIHSFKITHNIWVQYNEGENISYIFDDRDWNSRIITVADVSIKTDTQDGYFTHFSSSSISQGSLAKKILRAMIAWVPKLSTLATSYDTISSGTKLETGSLHPTEKYAKEVKATKDKLQYSNDHITIQVVATGVNSVEFNYKYTTSIK